MMRIAFVLVIAAVGLAAALFSARAAPTGLPAAAAPPASVGLFGDSTRALGLGMVGLGMVAWSLQRGRSRENDWDDETRSD